jgi:diacylglycerol kinase family enzyme
VIDLLRRRVRTTFERARPYAVRDVHVEHAALLVDWRMPERATLRAAADHSGAETYVLEQGDDPGGVARSAIAAGADALGVAGPDALLGPVADVAAHAGLPVFCAPSRMGHGLARDLRLDANDPTETLEAMARSEEILVDYCLANGRPFVNHLAVGQMPALVHGAGPGPDVLLGSGSGDGGRRRYATPEGGGDRHTALLMVTNNPMYLGGHPDFGRRMRLDAGVLGMVGLQSLPDDVTPETPLSACPSLNVWHDTELHIESDAPILATVDGVAVTFTSPLDIISRRKALAMLVPAGTRPGCIPSRQAGAAQLSDLAGSVAADGGGVHDGGLFSVRPTAAPRAGS